MLCMRVPCEELDEAGKVRHAAPGAANIGAVVEVVIHGGPHEGYDDRIALGGLAIPGGLCGGAIDAVVVTVHVHKDVPVLA